MNYYISGVTATLALADTDPDDAPANQHEFLVAEDLTAPLIAHDPKTERSMYVWPVPVAATVSDNQGVGQVALEFRINGIDRGRVVLSGEGDGVYDGTFGGSVGIGDLVEYRIKAVDIAETPNTSYLPAAGYFALPIVRDVVTGFEDGLQDWSHAVGTEGYVDDWHLSTEKNHTLGGATSWKFGDTGTGPYSDSADGILETLPVRIGAGAHLDVLALDGCRAEQLVHSVGRWFGRVLDRRGSELGTADPGRRLQPHDRRQPRESLRCGLSLLERLVRLDFGRVRPFGLRRPDAEPALAVRERRLRDGGRLVRVDDLVLIPTTDEAADVADGTDLLPARTALLGGVPNPFNPRTMIRFAVAADAGPVKLTIHDATGRLVRTLVDAPVMPGRHEIEWRGTDDQGHAVSTGIYFVRINAKDVDEAKKLVMMK